MATATLSAKAALFRVPNFQIAWVELDLPAAATTLAPLAATATLASTSGVGASAALSAVTGTTNAPSAVGASAMLAAQATLAPSAKAFATLRASASLSTGNYAGTILADDPSGFWRLAEASGTVAVDSGTHGNTGTYSGGVTLGQAGAFSVDHHTSVLFDGSTSDVAVPMPATSSYSMEAWVRAGGAWLGGNRMVLTTFTGGDQLSVGLGPVIGGLGFTVNLVGVGQEGTIGDGLSSTGSWHHIVGTYDGQLATVYHNGIEVGGNQFVGSEYGTSGTGHIGNSVGLAAFFLGFIQDVAFYSTRLSSARVTTHYQSGILTGGTVGVSAGAALTAIAQSAAVGSIKQSTVVIATATSSESILVATSTTVTSTDTITTTTSLIVSSSLSATSTMVQVTAVKTTSNFAALAVITSATTIKVSATLAGIAVLTIGLINVVSSTASLIATAAITTLAKVSVAQSNPTNAATVSAQSVAASSQLSALAGGSFVDQSITLSPAFDFQSAAPLVITLTGLNTAWSGATNWTLIETGASLSNSSIVVNSPTSATWTITTGPGVGNINISDGIVSANLPVLAGEAITLSPTSDIVNGPLVVMLIGAGTAWTTSTSWTITPAGASLDSSSVVVNSPSSATWTIMTGPGVGSINISDGIASANLLVTAGAAQLLSAIDTLTSAQTVAVAESMSANAALAIQVGFVKSALLTATATMAASDSPQARASLVAAASLTTGSAVSAAATLLATATITQVVAIGVVATSAASASMMTSVLVSVACTCSASATITLAAAIGNTFSGTATASLTTKQGITVATPLAAIAVMTANPSGTVNGNAALSAVAALTTISAVGAGATFAATAQITAVAGAGAQATLNGQEALVETIGPNIVAMAAITTMLNAAGVGASGANAATSVLSETQAGSAAASCSAVTAIATTQTLSFIGNASLVASASLVTTSFLTTLEDVRPLAFTTLMAVGKPVAKCAMSARAATQTISGPPLVGSAILSAKGILQGTPLSVTAGTAQLRSSTTLISALPSPWIGRLGVHKNRPDYRRARAVR